MSRPLDRDLWLVANAEPIIDTVAGLANGMNSILGRNVRQDINAARVRAAQEIVGRYGSLVLAVTPSVLEYREDMTEEELRRWAQSLIVALRY